MQQLNVRTRKSDKKSSVKALRREGQVPCVIYHRSKDAETLSVNAVEFSTLLRQLVPARLSTTVFSLKDDKGHTRRAIIKDIQYNPVTYDVIHLDFEELIDDVTVNVKVPIECTNVADCIGIKLGGFLRQVIRHIKVNCLPKDMPTHFELDVKSMEIYGQRRAKDLAIPQTMRPLTNLNEVILVIAKR
jgi:large subunit ribosomal protein L25